MRNILLVCMLTALSVSMATADPLAPQKPARTATPTTAIPDKPLPKRSGDNACAAYGPNFVKVNGSDTCVRVGGDMSVGVSGRR
jgi:hypothetical protein